MLLHDFSTTDEANQRCTANVTSESPLDCHKLLQVRARQPNQTAGPSHVVTVVTTHKNPVSTHVFYRMRYVGLGRYVGIDGNDKHLAIQPEILTSKDKSYFWAILPTKTENVYTLKNRKFPNAQICLQRADRNWYTWNRTKVDTLYVDTNPNGCSRGILKFSILQEDFSEESEALNVISLVVNNNSCVSICPYCKFDRNISTFILNSDLEEKAYFTLEDIDMNSTDKSINTTFISLNYLAKATTELFMNKSRNNHLSPQNHTVEREVYLNKQISLRFKNFEQKQFKDFFKDSTLTLLERVATKFRKSTRDCKVTYKEIVVECSFSEKVDIKLTFQTPSLRKTTVSGNVTKYKYNSYEFSEIIFFQALALMIKPCDNEKWCESFEPLPGHFLKEMFLGSNIKEENIQAHDDYILFNRTGYMNVVYDETINDIIGETGKDFCGSSDAYPTY